MEFALAGGVAAYGSAGGAAGGTAVGAFLASNPIGWIIAAVIVIVVVIVVVAVYWDEICNFFSSVGNAISDAAKVIWEFVTTPAIPAPPPAIDDRLPAPAPPVVEPIEEPITVPIAPPISIPTTKPRTRRREKDIYNVYDLHVGTPGLLRNYTFGAGFVQEFMLSAAIWKFGLTSFKSVYARYLVMYQLYHGDKDEYILSCLGNGKLLPFEWYLQNVNYATANADEVARIDGYAATHGKLPPGNTFRG